MALEWTTLDFIEHAPTIAKIATFVAAIMLLAVLESRDWMNFKGPRYFRTAVVALLIIYAAAVGYGYWSLSKSNDHTSGQHSPTASPPDREQWDPRHQLSQQFLTNLGFDFLRLPRPCILKIAAPQATMLVRNQLAGIAINARIALLNRQDAPSIIAPCSIVDEEKDRSYPLYGEHNFPKAGIRIHAASQETREFMAAIFRSQSIPSVTDGIVPNGLPDGTIYIEIGSQLSQ